MTDDLGESSLPPPMPSPIPASPPPAAPGVGPRPAPLDPFGAATETVVEPIAATSGPPPGGRRWAVRAGALVGAAALVGGGALIALQAGSSEDGADSPEGAVADILEALSNEDLVGAAELVEPSERETMVEFGFDLVDELQRLEVLSADLDMGAVSGVDLEYDDFTYVTETVNNGVVQVYIQGGTISGTYSVRDMPLGPLVVDRLPAEVLDASGSASEVATPSNTPVVVVERDGRWYVSLWYSVAENARLESGLPVPNPALRPAAIGADSPEAAVRALLDEAMALDAARVIGMLDPAEAAALYDYSPLFLDDADRAAREVLQEARLGGVTWSLDSLEMSTDTDGDRATVVVDGFRFAIDGDAPDEQVLVEYGDGSMRFEYVEYDWWTEEEVAYVVETDGDCISSAATHPNGETELEEFCTGEILGSFGLAEWASGLTTLDQAYGLETVQRDGRWFVSPTLTITESMLGAMRSITAEDLAEMVDSFTDAVDEGFGGTAARGWEDIESLEDEVPLEEWDEVFEGLEPFTEVEPPLLVPTTTTIVTFDLEIDPDTTPATTAPFDGETIEVPTTTYPLFDDGSDLLPNADYGIVEPLDYAGELGFWLSDAPPFDGFIRGAYGESRGSENTFPRTVAEFETEDQAHALFDAIVATDPDVVPVVGGGVLMSDSFGDPMVAVLEGRFVVTVNSWGGNVDLDDLTAAAQELRPHLQSLS